MTVIWTLLVFVLVGGTAVAAGYIGWRMSKGYVKLQASRTVKAHEHVWSPWEDHEVGLWDNGTLVRYAPGQLRTCLDPSCGLEDVRYVGGQTTSGEKDLS